MSWEALSAVTRTLDANQQMAHVADVRQAVRFAVSDLKGQDLLPGFCLPKVRFTNADNPSCFFFACFFLN